MSIESIVANLRRFRLPGAQEPMSEREKARRAVVDFGIYEISRDGGWRDEWVRGVLKPEDRTVALLEITNHIYGFALRKEFKERDLEGLAEAVLIEIRRKVAATMTPKSKRK